MISGTRIVDAGLPRMHQWRLDPNADAVTERELDDIPSEYPRIADDRSGLPNRFTYTSSFRYEAEPDHTDLYRYDADTGARDAFHFSSGSTCGEAVFVRRGDASEDDGYLLTFVHDRARDASSLVVIAAQDIASGPIAELRLPVRVPNGFHGNWTGRP